MSKLSCRHCVKKVITYITSVGKQFKHFNFQALYLDAVKFLPEELPEVQDLLIEKELRLHTTPEEIEVLRD